MNNQEFITKAKQIATGYKTVYMWGTFGAPLSQSLIAQKAKQYPSFYPAATQRNLQSLIGKGYYAFDCVGLIKGILWGWDAEALKAYGGATYKSNGVPDTGANGFINLCKEVNTNFSTIVPGEVVWMNGHIGIYIGSGRVIEATPAWANGVQITACANIGNVAGLNSRTWTKHGKVPYISYVSTTTLEIPAISLYNTQSNIASDAEAFINLGVRLYAEQKTEGANKGRWAIEIPKQSMIFETVDDARHVATLLKSLGHSLITVP